MYRILLVNDNNDWLSWWKIWLTAEGLIVTVSLNGVLLKEQIAREKPALIIVDVVMGDSSGEDICRRLKADPETAPIPVVLFSSHRQLASIAAACNADAYISKAATPRELKDLVVRVLSK